MTIEEARKILSADDFAYAVECGKEWAEQEIELYRDQYGGEPSTLCDWASNYCGHNPFQNTDRVDEYEAFRFVVEAATEATWNAAAGYDVVAP